MALAYIIDGGLNDPPGIGTDLHDSYPAIRTLYTQAAEWTGVPVERLLSREPDGDSAYQQIGAIRRAAIVLGICDVLAEKGVRPDVVAGMSLGAMIGSAVTGAVRRQDLFGLLAWLRVAPPPPDGAQGVGQLRVPAGVDPREFVGGFPDGVRIAAEIGLTGDGTAQVLLLSGYRSALEELAERAPAGAVVQIAPNATRAFHSPLQGYVRDFAEPVVAAMPVMAPEVPLCGGLAPGQYQTGEDVRSMFRRNHTDPISLPRMLGCLDEHGTELSLLIGPAMVDRYLAAVTHAVVHVECPGHFAAAFTAVQEFGLVGDRRG